MKIGQRIRDIRKSKNIKVKELANAAFISQPYLSEIENDKTTPSLDTLKLLCDSLDITLGEFFGLFELPSDLISLLETAKKLSVEERKTLTAFLKTIINERCE